MARAKMPELLKTLTWRELHRRDVSEKIMFRGDSLTTKLMDAYWHETAGEYVRSIMTPLFEKVSDPSLSFEVDPDRLGTDVTQGTLDQNVANLTEACTIAFERIYDGAKIIPVVFRDLFSHIKREVGKKFPGNQYVQYYSVASFLVLRFICPVLPSPERWNMISERPAPKVRRALILTAKVLNTLGCFADFTKKEPFMAAFTPFVQKHHRDMRGYLDFVCSEKQAATVRPVPVSAEQTSRDLAQVHHVLKASLPRLEKQMCSRQLQAAPLYGLLVDALNQVDDAIEAAKLS